MAFQAEQKIKADILRSLSTEQLFRLLSDSDLNVLMKTLGLLRNLLSTRPVSKITEVSRLAPPACALWNIALPFLSKCDRKTSSQRGEDVMSTLVTFRGVLGAASPKCHLTLHSCTACPVSFPFSLATYEPAVIRYFILTWFAGHGGFSYGLISYLWGLWFFHFREAPSVPFRRHTSPAPHTHPSPHVLDCPPKVSLWRTVGVWRSRGSRALLWGPSHCS